jgi:acyl-CoA reductase-like NAD-dependent aldehyde dehydrogenase
MTEYRNFIGGEWVPASGGATYEDRNPYTGETLATVAAGTRDDARRAVEAAQAAFPAWSQTPPAERQRIFLAAADILERRSDEVVGLLASETGCCIYGFGMFQMGFVPGLLRQAAALAYSPIGQILPSTCPGPMAMGLRRPVGVVGAIFPWNAALILSARASRPPGPRQHGGGQAVRGVPVRGRAALGEIFAEAGLPDGVLNIVTHAPGEAAPSARSWSSTRRCAGSTSPAPPPPGRKPGRGRRPHLKRVVLELGGHNPLLVLDDADLDYAVDASAFGAFLHQGQICMSARRLLVDRRIADSYLDRLADKTAGLKVGDPAVAGTVIGPLINQRALDTVAGRVAEAVAGGAKVLAGGERVGRSFQATLVADVPADSELARLETFGPVATVEVVDGADAAVARANDTAYGLAAGIITGDPDRGLALADRLQAGIVHVNDQPVGDEPQMPFGGVKDSGWGRFGGQAAVDEFTELKWVTVQSGTRPFPF